MLVHNGSDPVEVLEEAQEDEFLVDDGAPAEHANQIVDGRGPVEHNSRGLRLPKAVLKVIECYMPLCLDSIHTQIAHLL